MWLVHPHASTPSPNPRPLSCPRFFFPFHSLCECPGPTNSFTNRLTPLYCKRTAANHRPSSPSLPSSNYRARHTTDGTVMATNSIKLLTGNSHPHLASLVAARYVIPCFGFCLCTLALAPTFYLLIPSRNIVSPPAPCFV